MGLTLIRQEDDIRQSDAYGDAVAPTEANFETNPANLEDDMNNLRSQMHNLLKNQAGNWWDDLNVPATLDPGGQRGVNDLNTDLHALERKRVLIKAISIVDIAIAAGVAATQTLTSTGAFSDGETVTIGSRTYTFKTPFVDAANNIDASGTIAVTHENLRRAINDDGVAGTDYGTGTAVNADVTAADTATTNIITARKAGTFANSIATTFSGANISWGAVTMTGGTGGDVVILGTGELPPNTTAAVGAVTTAGTVVVAHTGTFGQATLDEIAGGTAITPKNFVEVVDATTRDPILSDGRSIYGLTQGESGLTDGTTITDTTTTRAQVTFVRINDTGDDLETIDGTDLGGKSVNLCYTERKALEDLTEQDFLRGAVTDVPSSSVVTRQAGYDNQGVTHVDATTNSDLDLEGPGLYWGLNDDLEATLFRVTEGSAGGTSTVLFGTDVDTFDNNAIANDFATGSTFNSGGTRPIEVGETDGVIGTTAGDLKLDAAAELAFEDVNKTGSTWAGELLLSDTTAEWDDYETAFGGEVSLLNAIVAAFNAGADPVRLFHNPSGSIAKDADTGGAGTAANNLDVDWPDAYVTVGILNTWLYVNGRLMQPGANAAANNDYYPGTTFTAGDVEIAFERKLKVGDVLISVVHP